MKKLREWIEIKLLNWIYKGGSGIYIGKGQKFDAADCDLFFTGDGIKIRPTTALPDEPDRCVIPPEGWACTRLKGHEGPCAAIQKIL